MVTKLQLNNEENTFQAVSPVKVCCYWGKKRYEHLVRCHEKIIKKWKLSIYLPKGGQ